MTQDHFLVHLAVILVIVLCLTSVAHVIHSCLIKMNHLWFLRRMFHGILGIQHLMLHLPWPFIWIPSRTYDTRKPFWPFGTLSLWEMRHFLTFVLLSFVIDWCSFVLCDSVILDFNCLICKLATLLSCFAENLECS